jgi:hypothetical protein
MKKIITISLIFLVFISCKKLEDLNKNVKDPLTVPGETLFTNGQKKLFDQMVSSNVNFNIFRLVDQYWTEVTYVDESNYDLITRTIPDWHWRHLYEDVLKNFSDGKAFIQSAQILTSDDSIIKQNKIAIIDIMEVYTYSVLVETFGNIPYSEAINVNNLLPKYDDAFTIYKDLLTRLDNDLSKMDPTFDSFGSADNMYQGDVNSWVKFANSLKLRMGMHLADKDDALAKATVESAAPNVFSSNADDAKLPYLKSTPNTNPIYVDLVSSGRHDFVASRTITDTMNNLNDPRMTLFFANPVAFKYRKVNNKNQDSVVTNMGRIFVYRDINGDDSMVFKKPPYTVLASDSLKVRFYIGGINGVANSFSRSTHVADKIQEPTFPGTILDYAEVEFFLAEAVERGYSVGGTAAGHYNAAITASIEDWGGTTADATAYLANPDVAYTTAKGNYKEKIGLQFWLALYNRGFEGWTEWRRLDYPVLRAPANAKVAADGKVPVRFTYPIEEQTLNGANYQAASSAIGGDVMTTKLFWDKY